MSTAATSAAPAPAELSESELLALRSKFPALAQTMPSGKPIVFLDSPSF